ncbi:MAG: hypothetical protein ABSB78_14965, partial [Bacteroidota bacterium]
GYYGYVVWSVISQMQPSVACVPPGADAPHIPLIFLFSPWTSLEEKPFTSILGDKFAFSILRNNFPSSASCPDLDRSRIAFSF